ncbi:MAG: hypothetical protein U0517_04315 [Candidatus Andersenbacteria bacterium]
MIGNAAVVARVKRALASGQLHALLFTGPRSVGKATFAFELAQERLGHPYRAPDPDVLLLEPTDGKKIGLEAVTLLLSKTRQVATSQRTISISEADRLTPEAANALLIFLENPPRSTLIILTALSATAVLPTIRSRCAPFGFGLVPAQELRAGLAKLQASDPELLERAVRAAAGRPGIAVTYLRDPQLRVALQATLQAAEQWLAGDGVSRLRLAATLSEDPLKARRFLEYLAEHGPVASRPALLLALRRLEHNVTPRAVLEAFAMLPT